MTAAPGEANIPTTRKTFIPLGKPPHTPLLPRTISHPPENNPSVFTHLAHHLGVSPTLAFYDIYTLTSPQIPRPAYALIFICPANVYFKARLAEYELQDEYQGSGPDEPVIWFKQTIRRTLPPFSFSSNKKPHHNRFAQPTYSSIATNPEPITDACGLMSLLHAISNGGAKSHIHPSSPLAALLREATPLKTVPRAQLLYDSPALEAAHALAAQLGDTVPPPGEEENGFHFITFLKGEDGHL